MGSDSSQPMRLVFTRHVADVLLTRGRIIEWPTSSTSWSNTSCTPSLRFADTSLNNAPFERAKFWPSCFDTTRADSCSFTTKGENQYNVYTVWADNLYKRKYLMETHLVCLVGNYIFHDALRCECIQLGKPCATAWLQAISSGFSNRNFLRIGKLTSRHRKSPYLRYHTWGWHLVRLCSSLKWVYGICT